jgi:hypothetical protein
MYYFDYAYTGKTQPIKAKPAATKSKKHRAKTGFTTSRTAHYKNHKDNLHEKVEFVKSATCPALPKSVLTCFGKLLTFMNEKMRALLQVKLSHCRKS